MDDFTPEWVVFDNSDKKKHGIVCTHGSMASCTQRLKQLACCLFTSWHINVATEFLPAFYGISLQQPFG